MDKHSILKKYFGYDDFRKGQEQIIDNICKGKDVICVMPTGAGKSICFQVPALLMQGVTIVVSPLISLMKDQIYTLTQNGIPSAYINSSMEEDEYRTVLKNLFAGKYKLLYVTPERLESDYFRNIAQQLNISFIAIDEAHCVSQWGQDFRPSYMNIKSFVECLPTRPVVGAFTATATSQVKEDIIDMLNLNNPYATTTGFDRENLYFEVTQTTTKNSSLIEYLNKYKGLSGIVYGATRRIVEDVYEYLNSKGYSVAKYHAGLTLQQRKQAQEDFIYDKVNIMVATTAFGMGIDKSNVSFVIHYNMPRNLEAYYQEAGRAGRDGSKADCILLYNSQDIKINEYLINNRGEQDLTPQQEKQLKEKDMQLLNQMIYYCTTTNCLRKYILNYFGQYGDDFCGNCSSCLNKEDEIDVTEQARLVLKCISATNQRFGVKKIIEILRGTATFTAYNVQNLYGKLDDCSEDMLKMIFDVLFVNGYIKKSTGDYPVVQLDDSYTQLFKSYASLSLKFKQKNTNFVTEKNNSNKNIKDINLFNYLKELRLKIAKMDGVPAYVVFTDAVLVQIANLKPKSQSEFMQISGIGAEKSKKYADKFIKAIFEYENI